MGDGNTCQGQKNDQETLVKLVTSMTFLLPLFETVSCVCRNSTDITFFLCYLSSTIGRGPLLRPKCMGLHLSRATHLIEQAGKRNNTLTIIVILVENNIIISASTLFQTLTNLQKGLMILVERPSVVTPKEATTVHVRQASLMVKPAQVITDSCLLLSLFICSIPLFAVLN